MTDKCKRALKSTKLAKAQSYKAAMETMLSLPLLDIYVREEAKMKTHTLKCG